MTEKNKFLTKDTKVFSVVTSVLIGIALIVLVIIGLMSGNFLNISVIGSSVIVFVVGIFLGSMQIKIFFDYKSQKKYLCADGIFNICLTVLVAISALVFLFVRQSQFDLRYFIFVFAIAFAVWKMVIAAYGFKNKRFNAFVELLIAIFWILSGIAVLLTAVNDNQAFIYLLCVSNYLLGITTIFYILYSYVFKDPDFLETREAIELLQKDQEERLQRLNRFNSRFNSYQQSPIPTNTEKKVEDNLEEKLLKLKSLKDKNFITEEEYEKRKKELLDKEL